MGLGNSSVLQDVAYRSRNLAAKKRINEAVSTLERNMDQFSQSEKDEAQCLVLQYCLGEKTPGSLRKAHDIAETELGTETANDDKKSKNLTWIMMVNQLVAAEVYLLLGTIEKAEKYLDRLYDWTGPNQVNAWRSRSNRKIPVAAQLFLSQHGIAVRSSNDDQMRQSLLNFVSKEIARIRVNLEQWNRKLKKSKKESKAHRDKGTSALQRNSIGRHFDENIQACREATGLYNKALNAARTYDDKASALKNIGLANFHAARLQVKRAQEATSSPSSSSSPSPSPMKQQMLGAAASHFQEALYATEQSIRYGVYSKSNEWIQQIYERLQCWTTEIVDALHPNNELLNVAESKSQNVALWCLTHDRAKKWFQASVRSREKDDYRTCEREGNHAVQLGRRTVALLNTTDTDEKDVVNASCRYILHGTVKAQNEQIKERADELLSDIQTNLVICSGASLLNMGNDKLLSCLFAAENFDPELAWTAIDDFKAAAAQSQSRQVELEAEATGKIAETYSKLLKMNDKAHEYARKSHELALACSPKDFSGKSWFKTVLNIIKKTQEQTKEEEEKTRKPYREQLKPEIEKLDACSSWVEFLKFIYKTYPKKGKKLDEKELVPDNMKKLVRAAILIYHPDRVSSKNDFLDTVRHEEITKRLTRYYEFCK